MEVVERLGEVLRQAGFGSEASASLQVGGVVPPVDTLLALERPEDARLATLLELFANGRTVPRPEAQRAVAPLNLDDLLDAKLVELDGPGVRSRLRVSDFEGLILAGDPLHESIGADYVQALSLSSVYVAHLTVRRRVASALDLGTGSGVQALLAARHADRVVAVDISGHALTLARLNQRLNGVDQPIDWIEGDWLEPVRGQSFDLVVANPPFAISPDDAYRYRDSEGGRDELARRVVRDCAGLLAEGGFATVMCDWIYAGDAWEAPLREWTEGLGCDALLLRYQSRDPLTYAMVWNREQAGERLAHAETVQRWVSHYREAGIERIATGFVVLRRRSAPANWARGFGGDQLPNAAAGDQVERMFAAADFAASRSATEQLRALLSHPWRLVDGHRLDQRAVYQGGAYAGEARLGHYPGSGLHAEVDPRVLPVVVGCNGERPLGKLIEEAPVPEDLDRSGFHSLCLGAIRDLIARGYLVGDALSGS